MCVCVCVCVCVRVLACVCVCMCVHACVYAHIPYRSIHHTNNNWTCWVIHLTIDNVIAALMSISSVLSKYHKGNEYVP